MIVYKITNNINRKIYIGQTVRSIDERLSEHKRKKKPLISKAILKYGIENFSIEIIDNANDIAELNDKEDKWIKFYNCIAPNGYNQCGGGGNTLGYNHSECAKRKMSISKSKIFLGKNNPFYGKMHSDEQRIKWSKERRGRLLSTEWKENLKVSHFKKVINLDTEEVFNSVKLAAEKYGLKDTHISRVCKGKRKRTGGYRWMHYNKYMEMQKQFTQNEI